MIKIIILAGAISAMTWNSSGFGESCYTEGKGWWPARSDGTCAVADIEKAGEMAPTGWRKLPISTRP